MIVAIFFIPSFYPFTSRFVELINVFSFSGSSDASANIRISMQINGYQLWLKNIFFGYGSEGFMVMSKQPYYSHATLTELLTNFGIIGLLLFFGPFFYYLVISKKGSLSKEGFLIFTICLIVPELFGGVLLYEKDYFVIIAILSSVFNIEHAELDTFAKLKFQFKQKKHLFFDFYKGAFLGWFH